MRAKGPKGELLFGSCCRLLAQERMDWAAVTWAIAIFSVTVGKITVIQRPESLSKAVGETVNLNCTYEGPTGIGDYKWHRGTKQGNEVSNRTAEFRGRVFGPSKEDFSRRRDASIRIIELKPEDTGFYFCNVMIGIGVASGAGTTLRVIRDKPDSEDSSNDKYIIKIPSFGYVAAPVASLLISVVLIFVIRSCLKKATRQQPARPDPINAEIPEKETNNSSERRGTNGREEDNLNREEDNVQYATLNLRENNQTEHPLNQEAVLYATVK
ncbi:tyrosine-protein phosphatase non-receptor type substrate 1-like isoform X2 [Heterodontus francisci]|uniref:tyrosine-protein phosphatase non-receptor type substrate 1-like isoform X2 n=1 Tax=Heterodontus francisci TaxID=7792 RepID=UPI00355C6F16